MLTGCAGGTAANENTQVALVSRLTRVSVALDLSTVISIALRAQLKQWTLIANVDG